MKSSNEISIADKIVALTNNVDSKNIEGVKAQLAAFINNLINNNFSDLVQILYKIDVDEKKLKNILQENQHTDAASLISDLILARQLQKIELRKKFKKPGDNNENEYW